MSTDPRAVRWAKYVTAVIGALAVIWAVLMGWARFANRAETALSAPVTIMDELRGHHDTIQALSHIEADLELIRQGIVELKTAQDEYQDSAIAQRQRRFCRDNPGAC